MLLNLLLSGRDRRGNVVQAGEVAEWHKAEGDWVAFGDDLCDIQIRTVLSPAWVRDARNRRRRLSANPEALAEAAEDESQAGGGGSHRRRSAAQASRGTLVQESYFLLRLTASDEGYLRQIRMRVGDQCQLDGVLAILSTNLGDAIDEATLGQAPSPPFRVVGNAM